MIAGLGLADDGREPAQGLHLVEDFQIVAQGRVEVRAESLRRRFGLGQPHAPGFGRAEFDAAAVAGGEVEVVGFPAALLEQEQGAGGDELDVVRMREDGEGGFHGERRNGKPPPLAMPFFVRPAFAL